ncbi:MAG: hypothetical protein K8S21_11945 [Gemmatimonadetes bacterium]|nr:hypothetical protein [Gemmatimonadota bacterium]
MHPFARLRLFALLVTLTPLVAGAQRWRPIGKTVTGNEVFIDPSSISKKDSIITATVRVVFKEPTPTPKGPITGSRAIAMFNCARKTVAVKENIIWHDERKGTIFEKRTPRQPGFGPVFTSNFSGVALTYLCAPPTPAAPTTPAIPRPAPPHIPPLLSRIRI